LQKIFDCSSIAEVYKCGCDADDEKLADSKSKPKTPSVKDTKENKGDIKPAHTPLEFEEGGLTRGG
jgi:hypothetical protein